MVDVVVCAADGIAARTRHARSTTTRGIASLAIKLSSSSQINGGTAAVM
jgi:hypothetical protein